MNISDFIEKITEEGDEEEIYIEIDGVLHEFTIETVPETFDGFDSVYPACYKLVPKEEE